jgi:hypothetical protein
MKGRKQETNLSPGGRSFFHPIHERGQFSRSALERVISGCGTGVARFTRLNFFSQTG